MIYFYVIIAYLVVLIAVGAFRSRLVKTEVDFMVAGRRLSAKVLVGTLLATWIGSGSIFGGAGLAYDKGLPALWFDAGVWVAIIVLYLVAGRARRFGQLTMPDILEARYNKYARILGTLVTIVAYTAIVSYQFRAGGLVLNFTTGISPESGILITAIFAISYTVIAGMISVAYTDVVNGLIMIVGFFVSLPFLLDRAGGLEGVASALPVTHFQVFGEMTVREALGYSFATMLLLLGEGGMYQRFYSARDETAARRSVVGWMAGTIVLETLIVVLAVVGSSIFRGIDAETVLLHVVREALPVGIGCLCLAAIVAAIVSTADSFLLVPATNIARDIYQRFINPYVTSERLVLFSRVVVIVLGILAYVQVRFFARILEMAVYAYTMYGTGITPALLAAFFWKRATAEGGVSSIAAGMVTTALWEIMGHPWGVPTVYPALGLSLFCLVTVSFMTEKPQEEKWRQFAG